VTEAGWTRAAVDSPRPRADQQAAIAESVRWHARHDGGTPNQAANAARGLRFLRTGQWGSKPAALAWAASLDYPAEDVIAELTRALEETV